MPIDLFKGGEESLQSRLVFVGDIQRPDYTLGFSDDLRSFHKSEKSRIPAAVSVVTHNEIIPLRHCDRPEMPYCFDRRHTHYYMFGTFHVFGGEYGMVPELAGEIFYRAWIDTVITEFVAVYIEDIIFHFDPVTGLCYYSFNQPRAVIGGKANDYVASFRVGPFCNPV